jgi:hypothetical protein
VRPRHLATNPFKRVAWGAGSQVRSEPSPVKCRAAMLALLQPVSQTVVNNCQPWSKLGQTKQHRACPNVRHTLIWAAHLCTALRQALSGACCCRVTLADIGRSDPQPQQARVVLMQQTTRLLLGCWRTHVTAGLGQVLNQNRSHPPSTPQARHLQAPTVCRHLHTPKALATTPHTHVRTYT